MDCRAGLKLLDDKSIDMILTSPPFWSLRDYGDDTITIWDEKPECEHEWGEEITKKMTGGTKSNKVKIKGKDNFQIFKNNSTFCTKCGAWKGQLGLEPTFDLYITHLCDIFDEMKRVLKKTGTLWVNLGDTYNGSGGAGSQYNIWRKKHTQFGKIVKENGQSLPTNIKNYPKKCLCLIPFRFAMEMVNRGWILRNTIIWHKPNSMPSSATDRFTVDFEYLFFFSKNSKYYFEQQFEPYIEPMNRWGGEKLKAKGYSSWDDGTGQSTYRDRKMRPNPKGRNKRCVWSINTKPSLSSQAHFAVYPEKLCKAPIQAGCPKNGIVLDPFMGSGTTAAVARKLLRNFIGFDINSEYCNKIALTRLDKIPRQLNKFL